MDGGVAESRPPIVGRPAHDDAYMYTIHAADADSRASREDHRTADKYTATVSRGTGSGVFTHISQ